MEIAHILSGKLKKNREAYRGDKGPTQGLARQYSREGVCFAHSGPRFHPIILYGSRTTARNDLFLSTKPGVNPEHLMVWAPNQIKTRKKSKVHC